MGGALPLESGADAGNDPGAYPVDDILLSYENAEAAKLACPSEPMSRLRRLRAWFGQYSLGELTGEVIDRWVERRLAGEVGAYQRPETPGPRGRAAGAGALVRSSGACVVADGAP